MDIGKWIAAMMGTLLIAFCLVAAILYLLPLYQKIQLDQLCRDYMYQVNASEGLNIELRNRLTNELTQMGLSELEIQSPQEGQLKRREEKLFTIRGELRLRLPSGFLTFEERVVTYEYKGKVYGKRIIN